MAEREGGSVEGLHMSVLSKLLAMTEEEYHVYKVTSKGTYIYHGDGYEVLRVKLNADGSIPFLNVASKAIQQFYIDGTKFRI